MKQNRTLTEEIIDLQKIINEMGYLPKDRNEKYNYEIKLNRLQATLQQAIKDKERIEDIFEKLKLRILANSFRINSDGLVIDTDKIVRRNILNEIDKIKEEVLG